MPKPITFRFTRYEFPELIDLMRLTAAVEVGVNLGQFSYHLLKYSKLKVLWSIDSYPGKYRRAKAGAESLLSEFGDRSRLVIAPSMEVASRISIDPEFVYIDASHDYDSVRSDMEAWWPRVASGGVLAGHDYTMQHDGAIRAVDEFAEANGLQLYLTREAWHSWLFFKP